MASYVIAGPAGDEQLAECEYLGTQLTLSCEAAVRVVIKHPQEWPSFLSGVCASFGFKRKSTPIVFTADGALIGGLDEFRNHVMTMQLKQHYAVTTEIDRDVSVKRAAADLQEAEDGRMKAQVGPDLLARIATKVKEVRDEGLIQILDGLFDHIVEDGLEFYLKRSVLLTPTGEDMASDIAGRELPFTVAPELAAVMAAGSEERENLPAAPTPEEILLVTQDEIQESQSASSVDVSLSSASKGQEEEEDSEEEDEEEEIKPKAALLPVRETKGELEIWLAMEISELNIKDFLEKFQSQGKLRSALRSEKPVEVPHGMQTIRLPQTYVVEGLNSGYILAVHPFPLIPGQLFIFTADYTDEDGNWLVRDPSLMRNWIRLVSLPPQHPVHSENSSRVAQTESVAVAGPAIILANRGFTSQLVPVSLRNPRYSSLSVDQLKVSIRHILTEQDWRIWYDLIKQTSGIGFYQWLPYGCRHYHPLTVGCLSVLIPPFEGIPGPVPLLRLVEIANPQEDQFHLSQLPFDHIFHKITSQTLGFDLLPLYLTCMEALDLKHKSVGKI